MSLITSPGRLAALARTGRMESGGEAATDRVVQTVRDSLNVETVTFTLVSATEQVCTSASDQTGEVHEGLRLPLDRSIAPAVIRDGKTRIIHDIRQLTDKREFAVIRDLGYAAYMGTPVYAFGEPVGMLCALSRTPRFWQDAERTSLEHAAQEITPVLESPPAT